MAGIQTGRELYLCATQKIPRTLLVKYVETHDDTACDIHSFSAWMIRRLHALRTVDERLSPRAPHTAPQTTTGALVAHTTRPPSRPTQRQASKSRKTHQVTHKNHVYSARVSISMKIALMYTDCHSRQQFFAGQVPLSVVLLVRPPDTAVPPQHQVLPLPKPAAQPSSLSAQISGAASTNKTHCGNSCPAVSYNDGRCSCTAVARTTHPLWTYHQQHPLKQATQQKSTLFLPTEKVCYFKPLSPTSPHLQVTYLLKRSAYCLIPAVIAPLFRRAVPTHFT